MDNIISKESTVEEKAQWLLETTQRLFTPEPTIEEGVPVIERKKRTPIPRTKCVWLDKLPPPRLREGMDHPRKDTTKLSVERLNEHYILYSGFEPDKRSKLSRILMRAEQRTGFKFISRTVCEEHNGEMVWGCRIWRVS